MAKRGRGRPAKKAAERPVSFTVRLPRALRQELEASAKRNSGGSASREAIAALRFYLEHFGDKPSASNRDRALGFAVGLLAARTSQRTGADWQTDRYCNEALIAAIVDLVREFGPKPGPEPRQAFEVPEPFRRLGEVYAEPRSFGLALSNELITDLSSAAQQGKPAAEALSVSLGSSLTLSSSMPVVANLRKHLKIGQ